jgi:hypothetical protein
MVQKTRHSDVVAVSGEAELGDDVVRRDVVVQCSCVAQVDLEVCQWSALRDFDPRGVGVTHAVQVIHKVGYANKGHDVHIDLSYDTPLHRLVVQVRNIRRIDCDVLFGNAVVSICASHDGSLRCASRRFD